MDALECILSRRSVRNYLDKEVSDKDIETILEAAKFAPSAMNNQGWHYSLVTNKDWLAKMSKIIGETFSNPNYNVTYHAPLLIIVSHKDGNLIYDHDGSCALENIFLSARALGLGSCWINQLGEPILYKNPKFMELLKEAGVPEGYRVIGSAAIGYTNEFPLAKERKEHTVSYLK